jgi:tetrahydromethanopterin S-methyltransferase subunit F
MSERSGFIIRQREVANVRVMQRRNNSIYMAVNLFAREDALKPAEFTTSLGIFTSSGCKIDVSFHF